MHFEILVEDASGKKFLENILPKILGQNYADHSWDIKPYRGIGRLPRDMQATEDPAKRHLLSQLPRILKGYGRSLQAGTAAVVVVVDNDRRNCADFRRELLEVLAQCNPCPQTVFCLAIEEIEAWLLGAPDAVTRAYPRAKRTVLGSYVQDSICGTWEKIADVIYPGGSKVLSQKAYHEIGRAKCEWAEKITPFINPDDNASPSFQYFLGKLRVLVA